MSCESPPLRRDIRNKWLVSSDKQQLRGVLAGLRNRKADTPDHQARVIILGEGFPPGLPIKIGERRS